MNYLKIAEIPIYLNNMSEKSRNSDIFLKHVGKLVPFSDKQPMLKKMDLFNMKGSVC